MLDGRIIAPSDIRQINIRAINPPPSNPSLVQRLLDRVWFSWPPDAFEGEGLDVTEEFISGGPGSKSMEASIDVNISTPTADTKEVFVVHGRNDQARDALFTFLRAISLHPLEWSEAVQATGKTSPYIGEILDAAFSRAHAVIVLFTPDDESRLRESLWASNEPSHETELTGQARPNVLFEAGMAMAGNQDRTILVELGALRPFSDIAGRHTIRLDNSPERRQDLAIRLQSAGCPVNLSGTDWYSTGDFDSAIVPANQGPSDSSTVLERQSTVFEFPQLSEDAKELLTEASRDRSRMIRRLRVAGGLSIGTNGKSFGELGDVRSEARWDQAIQELLSQEFIDDPKGEGRLFEVTYRGFQLADGLGE